MKANYHTHTKRCNHAQGAEREYVEKAIEGGIRILGFSDHTPYPFPDGYTSSFRMRVNQFEDYVDTVLALKDEYKDEIEIHLGVEAEYYPAYFGKLRRMMEGYPVEYFLLGQHFIGNELDGLYSGAVTRDEKILEHYCRQVAEALETGCFTYLAHPDLINFRGSTAAYEKNMRWLCRQANKYAIPLEINFLGIEDNRQYPNMAFWKIAGEEGCRVIYGADAHRPEAVWLPDVYRKAEKITQRYGLKKTETAELKKPV